MSYNKKINVRGHSRRDPRINRIVNVSPYMRDQRYGSYSDNNTKRGKALTNREFLFGDFDGDKIKNIDDKYPLIKSHETVEEMQLSDALITLNKVHNESDKHRKEILDRFRKAIKESKPNIPDDMLESLTPSRAKTPISLLHKSLKKQIPETYDKIGMTYIGKEYNEMDKVRTILKKRFEVIEDRDYYQNPKLGYKAIHLLLKDDLTGEVFEVQLKTKRIKRITDINHTVYKKGIQNTNEFRRLINVSERADNGNKQAQKYIDNISNKEIERLLSKPETVGASEKKDFVIFAGDKYPVEEMEGKKYMRDGNLLLEVPEHLLGAVFEDYPTVVKQNPRHKTTLKKKTMIKEFPSSYSKAIQDLGRDDYEHSFGIDFERKLEQPQRLFAMKGGKEETLRMSDFEMYGHSHPNEWFPIPSTADIRGLSYLEPEFVVAGTTGSIIILNLKNKTKYQAWKKRMENIRGNTVPISRKEFEENIKSPKYAGDYHYSTFSNNDKGRKLFYDLTGVEMIPYEKGIKIEMKDDPILEKTIPTVPTSYLKKWEKDK